MSNDPAAQGAKEVQDKINETGCTGLDAVNQITDGLTMEALVAADVPEVKLVWNGNEIVFADEPNKGVAGIAPGSGDSLGELLVYRYNAYHDCLKRIKQLEDTFRHCHDARGQEDIDWCAKCGLNLRDPVHHAKKGE